MSRIYSVFPVFFLIIFPVSITFLPYVHGLVVLTASGAGIYYYFIHARYSRMNNDYEKQFYFAIWFFLLVAILVTMLAGVDAESYKKLGKFLYLLMTIPVYFYFRQVGVNYFVLWLGLVMGSIMSACVAVSDVWLGFFDSRFSGRASGILNPIIFGDLSLLLGMMSLVGIDWFKTRTRLYAIFSLLAFFLGLLSSLLSQARGGLLAIPLVLLIFIWFYSFRIERWKLGLWFVLFILLGFILYNIPELSIERRFSLAYKQVYSYLNNDISHMSRHIGSLGIRIESWLAAWQVFIDNIYLGVGWGNYQKSVSALVENGTRNNLVANFSHPHNQFLSSMVSGGILGFVAILALFILPVSIFIRVLRSSGVSVDIRRNALIGLIMVVSFAAFNLSESFLERSRPVAFFLFYLAVCMAGIHQKRRYFKSK